MTMLKFSRNYCQQVYSSLFICLSRYLGWTIPVRTSAWMASLGVQLLFIGLGECCWVGIDVVNRSILWWFRMYCVSLQNEDLIIVL